MAIPCGRHARPSTLNAATGRPPAKKERLDEVGETCYSGTHAKVAQLVEHSTENAGVVGSIPSLGTHHVPQPARASQDLTENTLYKFKEIR